MIWLSGDHHFGHENILRFCGRPFDTIYEHDEELIRRWNDVVAKDDEVYYEGDLSLGVYQEVSQVIARLNGNIYFMSYQFHHDRRWMEDIWRGKLTFSASAPVAIEAGIVMLKSADTDVVLCHFPIAEWPRKHYGAVHAHAHSHGNYHGEGALVDVGVDCHDYYPISLERAVHIAKTNAAK